MFERLPWHLLHPPAVDLGLLHWAKRGQWDELCKTRTKSLQKQGQQRRRVGFM